MIVEKIQNDLKEAMKNRDEGRVSTLRFLLAQIHNQEIALRFAQGKPFLQDKGLTDEEVIEVIAKQIKERKESIAAFKQGKREDLVRKEEAELEILSKYLPQQLSEEELERIVEQVITETGTSGQTDFGKVMGAVMGKVKGRAGGSQVAQLVKKHLAGS